MIIHTELSTLPDVIGGGACWYVKHHGEVTRFIAFSGASTAGPIFGLTDEPDEATFRAHFPMATFVVVEGLE